MDEEVPFHGFDVSCDSFFLSLSLALEISSVRERPGGVSEVWLVTGQIMKMDT